MTVDRIARVQSAGPRLCLYTSGGWFRASQRLTFKAKPKGYLAAPLLLRVNGQVNDGNTPFARSRTSWNFLSSVNSTISPGDGRVLSSGCDVDYHVGYRKGR